MIEQGDGARTAFAEHDAPPTAGPRPALRWVRADVRALPFTGAFDVAASFGAFGHFLPEERPTLFSQVHAALRPGGRFVFPLAAPLLVSGEVSSLGFAIALCVSASVVDSSPFSTAGALVLANTEEHRQQRTFRGLATWAFSMIGIAPVLTWLRGRTFRVLP